MKKREHRQHQYRAIVRLCYVETESNGLIVRALLSEQCKVEGQVGSPEAKTGTGIRHVFLGGLQ